MEWSGENTKPYQRKILLAEDACQYQCLKKKKPQKQMRATLESIKTTYPSIWRTGIHPGCNGALRPICTGLTHKEAKTVADKLFNDFILLFGFPCKIHHYMGKEFDKRLIGRLKELSGIRGSHTSPYHPEGREVHQDPAEHVKDLTEEEKADWKTSVPKVVHEYNSTHSEATGYSPYFLLFGRSPRFPINLLFNLGVSDKYEGHWDYVALPADRVLVRNLSEHGVPGKI